MGSRQPRRPGVYASLPDFPYSRLHPIAEPQEVAMPIPTRLLLAVPLAVIGLNANAGDLSVVGTGDGIDLLRALGEAYTADHPDANVIVPPSIGSGGGISAVGSNKDVLVRAARPL